MSEERIFPVCALCRNRIGREEFPQAYQKVASWTRKRSGGGEHGLVNPEYLAEWAHDHCVETAKLGKTGQRGLFR